MTANPYRSDRVAMVLLLFIGWISAAQAEMATGNSAVMNTQNSQSALQKMAVIMHRLKHFPSPQSKDTLKQIIEDKSTTARQKDLATAIINLNHRALVDDKIKLRKIMENQNAPMDERDLASIIYNLDHRPTKSDKSRLEQMMQ